MDVRARERVCAHAGDAWLRIEGAGWVPHATRNKWLVGRVQDSRGTGAETGHLNPDHQPAKSIEEQ
jgi:hypothetical protein